MRHFKKNAGVVKLVDTLDLGSSAARCGSSSLPARTTAKDFENIFQSLFFMIYCFLTIYNIFHKFRSLFSYKLVWYVFEKKKKFEIWRENYPYF